MDPKNIKNHIRQRFDDESFDVSSLANELKILESYLRETVNLNYNCSPHHLIETIRLEKAVLLLQKEHTNVYSVCSKIGYLNCKTFRTAFKKRTGISPHELKDILGTSKNVQGEIEKMMHHIWDSSNI